MFSKMFDKSNVLIEFRRDRNISGLLGNERGIKKICNKITETVSTFLFEHDAFNPMNTDLPVPP